MQNGGKDLHPRSCQGPLHQDPAAPHQLSRPAYLLSVEETLQELNANPDSGLTDEDAKARLGAVGLNVLESGGGISPFRILGGQIFNAMVLVSLRFLVYIDDSLC
jgi:Na+-exporting ATPase